MMHRRSFLSSLIGSAAVAVHVSGLPRGATAAPAELAGLHPGEDVFAYMRRVSSAKDTGLYRQILGAANEFKEGDEIVGVAAADDDSRHRARQLLSNTKLSAIDAHPPFEDRLFALLRQSVDQTARQVTTETTLGELKAFLLTRDEQAIRAIMPGLSSDAISCVVKLMSNQELITVGSKVFNPLHGSQVGARGYLGARIQPNSPTDNVDDIRWQVFDGWSYAVGDVLLGTNPVSSDPSSVAAIERTLQDLLVTFGIEKVMPHCVLAHIDVQAQVEKLWPGSTALWFQSIAGSDSANATFDVNLERMVEYASTRTGRYGLYFETGQGADFTNGHGHGFDMVMHESRKYGFARVLTQAVAKAHQPPSDRFRPWVHLNDVAGFIGPEVFRTREQLVRCCLEDIVMGKLHGLCIGLDVCSTLHMDVTLDDLDWCLDQVMPANPAYLMALPTKIDPMLGYLTTGYQDHVRLRDKFGYRVNDAMWKFFERLGVIDQQGQPTRHFGDPLWVYLQYCRAKGDTRNEQQIVGEGRGQLDAVRARGVFVAEGYGATPGQLEPRIEQDIRRIYADAKQSIWAEFDADFVETIPAAVSLKTQSMDRNEYILHPESGERLSNRSLDVLRRLRDRHRARYDVQIVVSDGLNALAIMDLGHLDPYLQRLRDVLRDQGFRAAPEHLVVTSGRVRAGYRIGEVLYGDLPQYRAILHIIGERPGTGHHTFSIYITAPEGSTWGSDGRVDHNITKVVSGVATSALLPEKGADETVRILGTMVA